VRTYIHDLKKTGELESANQARLALIARLDEVNQQLSESQRDAIASAEQLQV
jgi:hypothetical protein